MKIVPNYGIHATALAVAALLENMLIGESWNAETRQYDAELRSAPWYNGRERGIVFYMRDLQHTTQINIAVYEHRRSDHIEISLWYGKTFNPPTLQDYIGLAENGSPGESIMFAYNEHHRAMGWIFDQLTQFWKEHHVSVS
jgi:hypothetical protein